MESILDLSILLSFAGVLTVLTNIVVQVLKNVTNYKFPTNILAVIVSLTLTLTAFFTYCQISGILVTWYMVIAAIVGGFLVAYAAMFGFDKLKEALAQCSKH